METKRCESTFTPAGLQDRERCDNEADCYDWDCDEYLCADCVIQRHVGCSLIPIKTDDKDKECS